MTNFDRIKLMSVDELVVLIQEIGHDFKPYCGETCDSMCWKCCKDWLESELDGE